jgi:hypothetical protein
MLVFYLLPIFNNRYIAGKVAAVDAGGFPPLLAVLALGRKPILRVVIASG